MSEYTVNGLVQELASLPEIDRLLNPYASQHDPASAIRRDNLSRYLHDMLERQPRVLLLAEAPGYRGCAKTGIPVTSERIMLAGIEKWGLFGEGYRPVTDQPEGMAEMSATILWGALTDHLAQPPLIWNTVPLHPHKRGSQESNRTPTVGELEIGKPFVRAIMELFAFKEVCAVGRKAERVLGEMGIPCRYLRHPSQGGKADFIAGLKQLVS